MKQRSKFAIAVGIYPPSKGGDKGRVYLKLRFNDEYRRFRTEIFAEKTELTTIYNDEIAITVRLLYCIVDRLDKTPEGFSYEKAMEIYDSYYAEPNQYYETIGNLQEKINFLSNFVFVDIRYRNYFNEVREIPSNGTTTGLLEFISNKEAENFNESRINTTAAFRSTKNSLSKFLKGNDIQLEDITEAFILEYQEYLQQSGIAESTISFYLRSLRRILNAAEKEGYQFSDAKLFSNVNTKVLFSNVRDNGVILSMEQLHQLAKLPLKDNTRLELARDVFMFSFYLRGAELSAITQLKKDSIDGSYIIYNKRADGNEVRTLLEPAAKELISKYCGMNDPYLFPLLRYEAPKDYRAVRNHFGEWLNTLGEMLSPAVNLTFSSARATWEHLLEVTPVSTYFFEKDCAAVCES